MTDFTDADGISNEDADLFAAFADAGTDETIAAETIKIVEENPGLIGSTRSGVDPASITEGKVALVGAVVDNSISVKKLLAILAASHDQFVRALYPADKEDVAVLMTAVLLDGTVLYPLTRIKDVALLGREPREGDRQILDGLAYDDMATEFTLISSTPLRDRIEQLTAAMLVEATRFENPRINREVDIILVEVTDGLDNASVTGVEKLRAYMEEIDDTGTFTHAAMYIGNVPDENEPGYYTELARLRGYVRTFIPNAPATVQTMNLKDLLCWYFGQMGCRDGRVFLPGGDPRAIRRAIGQVSDLALQASQGAFRDL